MFDSFHEPLPAGVRGGTAPARHLLHEAGKFLIDVRLEQESGTHGFLTGQVLQRDAGLGATAGAGVLLAQGDRTLLAQAIGNSAGEFQLDFEGQNDLTLYLQIPGEQPIRIALPKPGEMPAPG
jgi:hypothetical protein